MRCLVRARQTGSGRGRGHQQSWSQLVPRALTTREASSNATFLYHYASGLEYGFLLDAYVNRFEAPGCRRVKQIDSSLRSRSADSAPADFLG